MKLTINGYYNLKFIDNETIEDIENGVQYKISKAVYEPKGYWSVEGEPLNQVNATDQLILCRHCGRKLESWENYCTGCANKVDR